MAGDPTLFAREDCVEGGACKSRYGVSDFGRCSLMPAGNHCEKITKHRIIVQTSIPIVGRKKRKGVGYVKEVCRKSLGGYGRVDWHGPCYREALRSRRDGSRFHYRSP